MSDTARRLFHLLPRYVRSRDVEAGGPLQALLSVIADQVDVVEGDIRQLYDNWFIETCADWAVPYIADLVGYRPVHDAGDPGPDVNREGRLLNAILVPRREVADTIHNRRRKGTLALVDQVAGDVTGWPARVVEAYRLLGVTQSLNQPRPDRGRLADLRAVDALDRIGGPFDELAHTIDVRRPNSARTPGRWNLPSLLLFAWRLPALPITRAPALHHNHPPQTLYGHEKHPAYALYSVSALGNDAPLYTLPRPQPDPTRVPGELGSPVPIRRRAFAERTADYYGPGKSLQVFVHGLDNLVPVAQIVPADLSDQPPPLKPGEVAVDPVLGLIAFAADPDARNRVWVSYYQGFSAPMGGGGYPRLLEPPGPGVLFYQVGGPGARPTAALGPRGKAVPHFRRIADALDQWDRDTTKGPLSATIEIVDSDEYPEAISVSVPAGVTLEIRAASGARPLLRFRPRSKHESDITEETETISVYGEDPDDPDPVPDDPTPGGRVVLDGLLIAGRYIEVTGALGELVVRHCTLVPGWSLTRRGEPTDDEGQSVRLVETGARLVVERSILGPIEVLRTEIAAPNVVHVRDSILDALDPDRDALASPDDCVVAQAALTVVRSTVLGAVRVHALDLAENSLFTGVVTVARSQRGCVRFCYVPPLKDTRTPRRYECQPDLAMSAATTEADGASAAARVVPRFVSLRYGSPSYARLADSCPVEIRRGADDESEMGAFHDLFQPQREANLRARLDEYTPAGVNAGLTLQPGDD